MHTTDQLNTALEGKYAIERRIGAGGMAVVYLARDLRHNRRVALKVLNPELGAVLGSERFMAEIQTTANLHHPNLLPLFDSGEAGGLLFYAMPFVEGETLRQRLQRERQLGVDEAVRLAVALGGALDYAHRHNVIHRDLKPENILLHEGQPLVMDFGIALAVSKAGGTRITQTGLSLGTPQYMSPEQATGDHSLDARSDIYSLGAVLYEMLIGDPPHTGSTVQAVIAKVITEQPRSVRATRPTVPEHVEAALMMSLAKLPADRFATAAEFAAALSGSRAIGLSTSAIKASVSSRNLGAGQRAAGARRREIAAWTLATGGLVAAATMFFWPRPRAPEASTVGRFAIQLPESVEVTIDAQGARMAMSRDGSRIAVVGSKGRETSIYVWSTDNPAGQSVRGTEGATTVTFSPTGDFLLFGAGVLRLLKVPIGGGSPSTVVTIPARASGQPLSGDYAIRTPSWGDGDQIVFSRGPELWVTTPEGTTPRRLATPDTLHGVTALGHPEILPGGTHALVEMRTSILDSITLGVVSLSDGSVKSLAVHGIGAHYAEPGYIVYGQRDGVVYAAPFSLRRRAITGASARILDDVISGVGSAPDVAVGQTGWMVFRTGGSEQLTKLVIVDRAGKERPLNTNLPVKGYNDPSISPDGKHIVVRARVTGGRGVSNGDLWLYDMESGALSMLAPNAGYRPKWTRDGSRVIYLNGTGANTEVRLRPWDGSGGDSVMVARPSIAEIEPGPKAGYSAIRTQSGGRDIFIGPTDSLSALRPFVEGPASETNPAISPDGQWLAYMSDETKTFEVYVRPLPGPGPRIPISVGGGEMPRWSRDGSTLFYRGPTQFMAATVSIGTTLTVVKREALFTDNNRTADGDGGRWDVFPNGREFLFAKAANRPPAASLYVLVNWQRLLGRAALQKAAP